METTTENPSPRKYRCTYCGRNVARVEIVESHRYYCLGTSEHLGTTVDDCRSHVCYHSAQRCMDWDNNDLDNDDAEPMRGSAHILMLRDREQTRLLFERMARGGRVTTALGIQPWGDYYGKLTDRFGVQWMFNCTLT